jgi:hypothetical protein
MIWLIIVISVNGGRPQVVEKVPYDDLHACQAEKALRDGRPSYFRAATGVSVERKVFCSNDPGAPVG